MQISSLPRGFLTFGFLFPNQVHPDLGSWRVLRQLTDSSKNATRWKWWVTIKSSISTRCRWHSRKVGLLSPQRKSHTCAYYSGQEFRGKRAEVGVGIGIQASDVEETVWHQSSRDGSAPARQETWESPPTPHHTPSITGRIWANQKSSKVAFCSLERDYF